MLEKGQRRQRHRRPFLFLSLPPPASLLSCYSPGQTQFHGHHDPWLFPSPVYKPLSFWAQEFHLMVDVAESPKVTRGSDQEQVALGSKAPGRHKPMSPLEVQETLLPVPRTAGGPCLPGSQLPTLSGPPPGCSCHLHGGLWKLGSRVWGNPYTHDSSSSDLFGGLSGPFSFSLCDSLSLSVSPRLAVQPALLPSLPHSRAFLQEAESEGPPRSGCHDISVGDGLCCTGLCAEHWPPAGGRALGSLSAVL